MIFVPSDTELGHAGKSQNLHQILPGLLEEVSFNGILIPFFIYGRAGRKKPLLQESSKPCLSLQICRGVIGQWLIGRVQPGQVASPSQGKQPHTHTLRVTS
ncbi:hypothetical protein ILYODFUR_032366 [Ilyodon furcidens]|uniref:Uncharacterized protein n=1 Tax=Ilyodon furcidens TaxID=33524 RepID=A0ABV0V9V1_9TELE